MKILVEKGCPFVVRQVSVLSRTSKHHFVDGND
jgi:hypothetical protein